METEHQLSVAPAEPGGDVTSDRERARQRLQSRRDFSSHLVAFVVINGFLVGAWAITGAGYFWPAWILAGWGVGLVLHAWETFIHRPVTEEDVDAELRRMHR